MSDTTVHVTETTTDVVEVSDGTTVMTEPITEVVVVEVFDDAVAVMTETITEVIEVGIAGPQGPTGATGPTGPQGPQGAAGGGNWAYIHDQGVAAAEWNIAHGLSGYPSVMVVDSSKRVVLGFVEYVDGGNVRVLFSGAFTGHAYLS